MDVSQHGGALRNALESRGLTRRPLRISPLRGYARCRDHRLAAVTTASRRLLNLSVCPNPLPCLHPDWSCAAPV